MCVCCVWVKITSEAQLHLPFLCFKPFISDVLNFKCLCCTWHLHLGRIVHSKNNCNQLMWDVTMSSQTIFTVFLRYRWLIPWSKVLRPQMGPTIPECQAFPGFGWAKPTSQGDLPLFPVGLATHLEMSLVEVFHQKTTSTADLIFPNKFALVDFFFEFPLEKFAFGSHGLTSLLQLRGRPWRKWPCCRPPRPRLGVWGRWKKQNVGLLKLLRVVKWC